MYDVTSGPNSSRMNSGGATERIGEWVRRPAHLARVGRGKPVAEGWPALVDSA
jgi:hypothetical protein